MKKKIISSVLLTAMAFGAVSAFAEELPMVTSAADEVIVGVPQITVDGEKLDLSKLNLSQYMYTEKENTLVPLRAVAEKMGYKVEWDNTDKAVTVSDDDWQVVLNIGVDSYYGVTKIKDAVGMTGPQSYGAAPELIEDTTFVPAKMFELMNYKYSQTENLVCFSRNGVISDESGNEYSSNTLIVSAAPGASEDELNKLFENNELEVIYKMSNFNMYAVKLKEPLTADEMDKLIAGLEKDKNISAVSKDYIVKLDN